jgi:hypothetical protein
MVQDFAKSLKNPDPQGTVPITEIRRDRALFDAVFRSPAARLSADTSVAVEDAKIVHTVAPNMGRVCTRAVFLGYESGRMQPGSEE